MEVVENTLFVTSERSYLRLDHDTILIEPEEGEKRTLPLLAFGGIVVFGDVMLSPALIRRCAEEGRTITYLDFAGRFRARVEGAISGNVLLRQAQYRAIDDTKKCLDLAKSFVLGKLQNVRHNLARSARESDHEEDSDVLRSAVEEVGNAIRHASGAADLEYLRGVEGEAARRSFSVWTNMVLTDRSVFGVSARSRRPPLDPTNATLSFLYTLITHDCRSALESVGLDPQAGFLHSLRPGRPALALDLMEEFRPVLGDRLALTLINRKQLTSEDFVTRPGGSVMFKDPARKQVLTSYIERKRETIFHRNSGRKIPLGLVLHLQAKLLARATRGELEHYPPFMYR